MLSLPAHPSLFYGLMVSQKQSLDFKCELNLETPLDCGCRMSCVVATGRISGRTAQQNVFLLYLVCAVINTYVHYISVNVNNYVKYLQKLV